MTAAQFTSIFIAALALTTLAKLWLARRHLAHIAAHRAAVPERSMKRSGLPIIKKRPTTRRQDALRHAGDAVRCRSVAGIYAGGRHPVHRGPLQSLVQRTDRARHGHHRCVLVIYSLLEAPFSIYRTFVIEARFGFNKMTFRLYLLDALKGMLIGAILGLPLLFGVLWLMARMGAYWWLYVWLVWVVFNLLILFIYPSFIAPLFNKFSPMQDDAMKSRIEALLPSAALPHRACS